ncbi:MAG TPA: response regulator [Kofleriaceae bacterium]
MTTILHIDDDLLLAEMVQVAFEAFGFRGTHLVAGSVREARAILADLTKHGHIDLIISDMQLGDGTGLDVIRYVRSHPARAHVPVLILSGNIDPATVNRAYALGANAYVHKAVLARSFTQVLESLQEHWLHDVRLPVPSCGRTFITVAREVSLHTHAARSDLSVAEHLGGSRPVSSLWVTMSLREGNLANLLAFLLSQLGERELSAEFLDEIERLQAHAERTLEALDGAPVHEPDEGLRHMLAFVSRTDAPPFSRAIGHLFPAAPVAIAALLDAAASGLEELAAWIQANASAPDLLAEVAQLRSSAAELRAATPNDTTGGTAGHHRSP